jgi:hypothetical protein
MSKKLIYILLFFIFHFSFFISSFSQDLLSELGDSDEKFYVNASFKNSKVINAQSLETTKNGELDFKIQHRFGTVNGGLYELFGLDNASMRMGFDYGINDRIQVGIGRSTYEKTVDGCLKARLLWQTDGSERMPISVLWYSSMSVNTLRYDNLAYERDFVSRLNYVHQLIIGRKFSSKFSLEVLPTLLHRNFVITNEEKNTVFSTGMAARVKLTQRLSLNGEYFYVMPGQLNPAYFNSLSVGVDIETGGHVFQLHFTNSAAMLDKAYIGETTGDWTKGDIYFGFNLSRVFTIKKPKKVEE